MSTIALLPGDGIGSEILDGPVAYLHALEREGAPVRLTGPWPYGTSGWQQIAGTSGGTPQWAALIAIADQGRALSGQSTSCGFGVRPRMRRRRNSSRSRLRHRFVRRRRVSRQRCFSSRHVIGERAFATKVNAKVFSFEFQLSQPVVQQQSNKLS